MAVIDINLTPSKRELTWFGLIQVVFFTLVGALVLWRAQSLSAALTIWSLGAMLALVYFVVRPLRRPMYFGWMYAVYPLGWTLSHLLLGAIFFLVIVPIGQTMRLCGRDPMQRKFEPNAPSYWALRNADSTPARYFRQF